MCTSNTNIPALLLRLSTRSTLLLHALTTRRLARHLLDFAEAVAAGVAVLAGGFHRVDAGLLVALGRDFPGFGARGGADCGLFGREVRGWTWWGDGMGWDGMARWIDRTSAAPLTYWAWPPMREGCWLWSDMVVCDLVGGLGDVLRGWCWGGFFFAVLGCLLGWWELVVKML
jgi:hypothetical protein